MSLEPRQHREKIFRIFKNRKAIHDHEDRRTASARGHVEVLLQAVLLIISIIQSQFTIFVVVYSS